MNFSEFISRYDTPGSVVLLEGKRTVKLEDCKKLMLLGEKVTRSSKYITFRSGNSSGSDYHFAKGVTNIDASRIEVIIPFDGYRKSFSKEIRTVSLDSINLIKESTVVFESEENYKTRKLVKQYLEGNRDNITRLISYIIRDTIKALGTTSGILPATAGIFYDDLEYPEQGGTGHTILTCRRNGIPTLNQLDWFNWLL